MSSTQTIKIQPLFPTILMAIDLERDFTPDEVMAFNNYEKFQRENNNNKTSVSSNVLIDPRLKNLKTWLTEQTQKYLDNIINPSTELKIKITTSWLNFTKKNESHHQHTHPNSFLSGVFYINCDQEDQITFYKNPKDSIRIVKKSYNDYNSESWWMPAITKRLYIFPSTLEHGVPKVKSNINRISLSYNTWLSGTIDGGDGGISNLEL